MSKRISIHTLASFTKDGEHLTIGGMERYIRDLAVLLVKRGYNVDIHQWADKDFEHEIEGIPVYGYNRKNGSDVLFRMEENSSEHIIYGWIGQQNRYKPNCISISHGVWWDNENNGTEVLQYIRPTLESGLKQSAAVVSVDYNFLNVCRAILPGLCSNISVIPNYVDTDIFKPSKRQDRGYIEVLYPRRCDPVRGIYEAMELADKVLAYHDKARFNFAIDSHNDNHSQVRESFKKWAMTHENKDRISYGDYSFDDMPAVYQNADIVILPSRAMEGTSLSCLEAMACGCAVVATNVGGLTNLIIDGHNGKIVSSQNDELETGVNQLINSSLFRSYLANNAIKVANVQNKWLWEARWITLAAKMFGAP